MAESIRRVALEGREGEGVVAYGHAPCTVG